MIAKIERKWGCVAKDYAKTDWPDAAGVNRPNIKAAPKLSARIRHGSGGREYSILKIDNLSYLCIQSNKSCTET
jgi:hypothetical protein